MAVPVLDKNKIPLMPCSEKRARTMMAKGEAKPYWKQGIFCIILQKDPSCREKQDVAIGIDPGSKRTGITLATEAKVVMNILVDTPYWVKDKVEFRKNLRRSRRYRNTPYRKCRYNRVIGGIPPSTKARWLAHLRVINIIKSLVPLTDVIIEDIKAVTKEGKRRWNKNFSPLEVGKQWFKEQVINMNLKYHTFMGYETKQQRDYRGFKKTNKKLDDRWEAHNVDSHCLIEMWFGNIEPFKGLYKCSLLNYYRRQLRKVNTQKGNKVIPYGSTMSMGLKRGTLVYHKKYKYCIVGGSSNNRISVHDIKTNKRLAKNIKVGDCIIKSRLMWRPFYISG